MLAACVAPGFGRGSGVASGNCGGLIPVERADGEVFTFGAVIRGCGPGTGPSEPVRPDPYDPRYAAPPPPPRGPS